MIEWTDILRRSSPPGELRIAWRDYQAVLNLAILSAPFEVCGFLAGKGSHVCGVLPVPNIASDPTTTFMMKGSDQFAAMREIAARKWELLAIYHSHPSGERPDPSPADVEQSQYPELLTVIISPMVTSASASMQAFTIVQGNVQAVPLIVVPNRQAACAQPCV